MTDKYDAKAREAIDSIDGADWRRFAEMGYSAPIVEAIASALRSAAAEEREACSAIADEMALSIAHGDGGEIWIASKIAKAIRSRGIPND